jgi:hypothetical protein
MLWSRQCCQSLEVGRATSVTTEPATKELKQSASGRFVPSISIQPNVRDISEGEQKHRHHQLSSIHIFHSRMGQMVASSVLAVLIGAPLIMVALFGFMYHPCVFLRPSAQRDIESAIADAAIALLACAVGGGAPRSWSNRRTSVRAAIDRDCPVVGRADPRRQNGLLGNRC